MRNPWGRLAMLVAVIVLGVAAAGLCVAWLVPEHVGESTASFALDALEEGRPQYYRPFNMGFDEDGRPYGMYLLRTGRGTEVLALFSRDPHPLACSVVLVLRQDGSLGYDSECSGGRFSSEGAIEDGGSPRALDRFAVEVVGASIDIDVTELILGRCASAAGGADCSSAVTTRTEPIDWPGN